MKSSLAIAGGDSTKGWRPGVPFAAGVLETQQLVAGLAAEQIHRR
jgi:hypothetical protein